MKTKDATGSVGAFIVSYYEKAPRKARVQHMIHDVGTRQAAEEIASDLLKRETVSDIMIHECSSHHYVLAD